jgi:hypothetical protein
MNEPRFKFQKSKFQGKFKHQGSTIKCSETIGGSFLKLEPSIEFERLGFDS